MTRYRFTVEYDGRPYMGWQRQPHGPSVQSAIETAIFAITGKSADVFACGRTDTGVHARAMPAHADIDWPRTPFRLMEAINALLKPQPVAILACAVAPDWHARFDCTGRQYHYRIINRRAPLTLMRDKAWHHGLARKTYIAILDIMEAPKPKVADGQIPPEDATLASYRRRLSSVVLS